MVINKCCPRFFSGKIAHPHPSSEVFQLGSPLNHASFTLSSARHDPRAVFQKLSDHTLFNRTYEIIEQKNGMRMLVPWTKNSSSQSNTFQITTFNAAMRSAKRGAGPFDYNTGLNKEESLEEYEDRTEMNGYLFGLAAKDSAIGNVLEGTIHANGLERFQKGLDRAYSGIFKIEDATPWGLITLSNRLLLPQGLIKKTHSPFKGKMTDLDDRIVTFKIPGYLTPFTTLHFPHGDPQKALELYAANKKENVFRGIEKGHTTITQVASGDFNRAPKLIEKAIRSKIETIFPPDFGVKTQCKILYNEGGHLRTTGESITVDASVTLLVEFASDQLQRAQEIVAAHRQEQTAPSSSSIGR